MIARLRGALIAMLLATALLFGAKADALDPERTISQYKHTRWMVTDGAPPIIYALAQGLDGYIWIGSAAGLYRFDGVNFEPIPLPERTASPARATALLAAKDGTIWVGYSNGDIATYRNGVLHLVSPAPANNFLVGSIAQSRDGAIWVNINRADKALLRYKDGRWEELGSDWGLPAEYPGHVTPARDGSLWVLGNKVIFRLAEGARRFEPVGKHVIGSSLSEDPDGRMWLSDRYGSRIVSGVAGDPPGRLLATPSFSGFPWFTFFDRDGSLWGIVGKGLFRMRRAADALRLPVNAQKERIDHFTARDGLTADSAQPFLEDREGNIWIGTTLGLDQFRNSRVVVDQRLAFDSGVRAPFLTASDGTVYLGPTNAVYRVEPGRDPDLLVSDIRHPYRLCEDKDADILAFYEVYPLDKLMKIDPANMDKEVLHRNADGKLFPASVSYCYLDEKKTMWIVSPRGISRLSSGILQRPMPASKLGTVQLMSRSPDGRLLAWMESGALVWLNEGKPGPVLLRGKAADVYFIYAGQRAIILGGTFGLGRIYQGKFQRLDPARFPWLADPHAFVETPDGQTWITSQTGIVGVSTAALDRAFNDPKAQVQPMVLDFEDGLQNVRSAYSNGVVRGGDGRLWFTMVGGFVWIDPARLHRNMVPPQVRIRGLATEGERYRDPTRLTLAKGTSRIAIQYAGLSMIAPRQLRFRYKLEGVDDDWIDAGGRRDASYTNLGAGRYRFHVIAANADGIWNREGATLDLTIPPTFLQSIWFKLLCGLALCLLIWIAVVLRVRQVQARLRNRYEIRMAERERIARELHDTLLQSVQGLILDVHSIGLRVPATSGLREPIEKALDHADAVLAEGRNRVGHLRSGDSDYDLAQAIHDAAAGIIPGDKPQFRLTVEGFERPLHALVGEELVRIAEEAVRNAVRHARSTSIDAVLTYGQRYLRFSIRDDGVGIAAAVLRMGGREGHYGLTGMRERAVRIAGRLTIASRPDGGTDLSIAVPAHSAYERNHSWLTDLLHFWRKRESISSRNAE